VLDEFIRDPRHARSLMQIETLADSDSPARRELGYSILVNLATHRIGRENVKAGARQIIEKAWADPQRSISLLRVIGRMRADAFSANVAELKRDGHPDVAQAATAAATQLRLDRAESTGGSLIESMPYETVVAEATKVKGDPQRGAELFVKQGCVVCHATSSTQPPKGPLLAGIAARYTRPELIESILRPSAKIAQGFDTQVFKTRSGEVVEGFVSRESGDEVEVRNATGVATVLKKSDIQARARRAYSVMPEGLAAKLTPDDLASLLSYLESLKTGG
jgi:putative heme-binding domain-containing protein